MSDAPNNNCRSQWIDARVTRKANTIVVDQKLTALIEAYRAAKLDHERQCAAQSAVNLAGNYEMDDAGISADVEASSSREQRAGLALADATARASRTSRPSLH
jgi:hypothetical protein